MQELKKLIQKELNDRKVYEHALDAVTQVEGLAQNKIELEAIIVKLKAEQSKEADKLKEAEAQTKDAAAKAEAILERAEVQAQDIVNIAKDKAGTITDKAAKDIIKMQTRLEGLNAAYEDLEKSIEEKQAQEAKLQAAIEDMKSRLSNFMG